MDKLIESSVFLKQKNNDINPKRQDRTGIFCSEYCVFWNQLFGHQWLSGHNSCTTFYYKLQVKHHTNAVL